ncbi:HpcH/HpaI aldolase/citrate lyase family protein [Kangiella sediminilitoris]|uniref:Citryl-CoA lyase n=1 Tax=Kangiella sediminilitoris TaxID=1144748 RepID=A0A1B3BA40_9GAMM|nr:CoA ester lyase [Kangiella sediminilitoris]AOE49645.1 Citryl-CoA lyase [Kangiella sediminilitoris]
MESSISYRPRRTMLYVPTHVDRYMEKARTLDADSIIFDFQESVPPQYKEAGRDILRRELSQSTDYNHSELVVRINPIDGEWGKGDLEAIADLKIDAVLIPRVESAAQLLETIDVIDQSRPDKVDIMVNIESPLGVLHAEEICAASDRLVAIVIGTTDLSNELKVNQTKDRLGLLPSLSIVMLAGRAYKKCVIDGPHFDLKSVEACEYSCRQARDLGFDGKAVVHPIQLDYTNDAFTPKQVDIRRAKDIIEAIEKANAEGRNVAVLDDRLIEPSLREWAERVIALYNTVKELGQNELLGSVR